MKAISVELRPPSRPGRLWPKYDREAGVIEVASEVAREWPYGVNIGASIVFDIDANMILANFDVLIPRKRWRKQADPKKPLHARDADLKFSHETLKQKSFSFPLVVSSDREGKRVVVAFQDSAADAPAVALSDRCFAYVRAGELLGFYLDLRE
jgi:hypothetical protein